MLRAASKFCIELEALVSARALLGCQIRRHSIKTVLCTSNKDQNKPTTSTTSTSANASASASCSTTQSGPDVATSKIQAQSSGSSDPTVCKSVGPTISPTVGPTVVQSAPAAPTYGPRVRPTSPVGPSAVQNAPASPTYGPLARAPGDPSSYDGNRKRDDGGGGSASYRLAAIGAVVAVTAAIGGAVYYKKKIEIPEQHIVSDIHQEAQSAKKAPSPNSGGAGAGAGTGVGQLAARLRLPGAVEFLVAGGGAAGAGGARTLRALDPDARVLIVGEEESLPYPRAPLTKQLWSDPNQLAKVVPSDAHKLTYTRWDGKTRNLAFEPESFYLPVESLEQSAGGVSVARGWRVERLDVPARTAHLRHVSTGETHAVTYSQCLIATGARPLRHPALGAVRSATHCGALHSVRGAGALARAVTRGATSVALVGDTERALELAHTLRTVCGDKSQCSIIQIIPGSYPLQHALPPYLQRDITAMMNAAGVTHVANSEIVKSELTKDDRVRLHLVSNGQERTLDVDYVVECLGYEADRSLAEASDLAVGSGPDGAICVSPTLQAAEGVWAAGAAMGVWCRRAPLSDSHEHALATARTAARNMTARDTGALTHHAHRALAWCDMSPHQGYEAIGVIDSNLRTVGIFSDDSIAKDAMSTGATESVPPAKAQIAPSAGQVSASSEEVGRVVPASEGLQRFKKGVVFYLDKNKIVGVLLWNLFNRSDIARQALLMGEVTDSDLVELGKHFSPQEP